MARRIPLFIIPALAGLAALIAAILTLFNGDVADWPAWGKWLMVGGLTLLTIIGAYASTLVPLLSVHDNHLNTYYLVFLQAFLEEYERLAPGGAARANVMMVRGPLWSRGLKMVGSEPDYPAHELDFTFPKGIGCCGEAWKTRRPHWYDTVRQPGAIKDMTPAQKELTKSLSSILSVPIFRPGDSGQRRVVGVLNLDSQKAVDQTRFDQEDVAKLALNYAGLVGGFCR